MPRMTTKKIIAALKKAGISIESDELDKLTTELEDLELPADELVGPDQIILSKDEHRELKDDLTKLRTRAKKAEGNEKDLREALDAGDSDNVRKAQRYKTKIEELEPQIKSLQEAQRTVWKGIEKEIPEKLQAQFRFAEKGEDGKPKELSISDLVHNIRKVEEYRAIGLIGGGAGDGDEEGAGEEEERGLLGAPKIKPGRKGGDKLSDDEMKGMTPGQLLEAGYKSTPSGTESAG